MNKWIKIFWIILGLVLFLAFSYTIYNFIGPVLVSIFLYYSVRPLNKKLIEKDFNKTVSAILSILAIIIPAIIIVLYSIQIIISEITDILNQIDISIQELTNILVPSELYIQLNSLRNLQSFEFSSISFESIDIEYISTFITSAELTFMISIFIGSILFDLFIVVMLTFYLLRDGNKIRKLLINIFNYDKLYIEYINSLDKSLKTAFFGNMLVAIITSLIGIIIYMLISQTMPNGNLLAYPALLGILCGITSLIPIVGMKLVYFPTTVILFGLNIAEASLAEALILPVVFFTASFIIIDSIPDYFIRPYLSSRGNLSTGLLFFSYALPPFVFGWYGLFLGPIIYISLYEYLKIVFKKLELN